MSFTFVKKGILGRKLDMNFKKKFIGDKHFYKMLMVIALPIIIQNGITNFVSLVDNIMIGVIGTEQMTGVSVVNQLMWVYNLSIFGLISGAGIFGAQFYGKGDEEGMRYTFRFKFVLSVVFSILAIIAFYIWGDGLISLFLHEGGETGDLEKALYYGKQYLLIMLITLLPNAITQSYASTLRERGQTVVPMVAGVVAVLINVCLNGVLIFGLFGFPALGVAGAAIATCIAKVAEMLVVIMWTHKHSEEHPFIKGAYKSIYVPRYLVVQILIKGTPLMFNEVMWSVGITFLMQCYSTRGLAVVAALNISNTLVNLFNVVFISIGLAITIIIGQLLGAGKLEEARDTDNKLIFTTISSCVVLGGIVMLIAPLFPQIYNTTDEVKTLATSFLRVSALFMPVAAFLNASYFTIRTGGRTFITFLFDSVFVWAITVPVAFVLTRYTSVDIIAIYFACQAVDILKCTIGFFLLRSGIWLNNIVDNDGK